jgi:hypothetical protein
MSWKTYGRIFFICILFNDAFSVGYLDNISSNVRMMDEGRIGKDVEGSGSGLIKVLSRHMLGRTEVNYESS